MPSTFGGLYISLRAMQAQQRALETSSHNIANATTPGFSRQRAVMATTAPWPVPSLNMPSGAGQVGTGVEVSHIERIRASFLDDQIRNELVKLGEWEQRADALDQVEAIFMEPTETGLNTLISQFWESWQELSKDPESSAVRTTVVETANSLADAFQHTHLQLSQLQDELGRLIDIELSQVNDLTSQIAALNKQIVNIKAADLSPNDLMDTRDLLLDELSKLVNIKVVEEKDGSATVYLRSVTGEFDGEDNEIREISNAFLPIISGEVSASLEIGDDDVLVWKGDGVGFSTTITVDEEEKDVEVEVINITDKLGIGGELKGLF